MKTRFKIIIGLLTVCAAAFLGAACSTDSSPYGGFDKNGYTVSVRYDSNGGMFANVSDRNLVDVFSASDVADGGVKLLEPGDSRRGAGTTRSVISRTGYFLAGWYREREPRVSDGGELLDIYGDPLVYDEDGEPLTEPGYVYSGFWDFENDVLEIEEGKTYTSGEVVMTLYAAWIPNFAYTFYAPSDDGSGWTEVGSYSFNPQIQSDELAIPSWNEETGAMDYGSFPQPTDKTFSAIYADEAMTEELEGSITHTGEIDYEKGIAYNPVVVFYTSWKDGLWYRIATAQQFLNNARIDGCYEIFADLDFTGLTWAAGLARGDFTGKIIGNGHTFSNISVTQTDNNTQLYGGLFGRIMEGAEIRDATFENVIYYLSAGTRVQGSSFGLFAGVLSENATIENVSVSGELQIGNVYALYAPGSDRQTYDGYSVGLLSGNLVTNGITYQITCKSVAVQSGTSIIYPCIAEADEEDGEVVIRANPDPSKDPYEND